MKTVFYQDFGHTQILVISNGSRMGEVKHVKYLEANINNIGQERQTLSDVSIIIMTLHVSKNHIIMCKITHKKSLKEI